MPTSPYSNTTFVLDFLGGLNMVSMLDLGAGFGRWGFLTRCHLCGGNSLTVFPGQELKIDAIEVFQRNINPVYQAVYNNVYEGDACDVLPGLGRYDVIVCGDMIEHLEKNKALALIAEMRRHADKAVILSLPVGDCPQGAIDGNEHEAHKSMWSVGELRELGAFVRIFPGLDRHANGVAIWSLSAESKWALKTTVNPVRKMLNRKYPGLLRCVRKWF